MASKTKEPLIHIFRRDMMPWYQSMGIRAGAVALSLVVCALVTVLTTGENPLNIFKAIWDASFISPRRTWLLFQNIAVLMLVSLAVVPAFKMRFWNLGGEGQVLIGCLASASCMICLREVLPNWLLIPVIIIASVLAGAVWGVIPALFKAKWGTNETLFTLMMNYIATQLVAFFIVVWEVPKGAGQIGIINSDGVGWLQPLNGDVYLFGQRYLLTILVAVALTVVMYIYLNYSKQGYEISVVGESVRTARYVGIKVEKVIIRTMIISGALCGLTGMLLTSATDHTLTTTLAGGRGFTAVMVAWLAKFNPIWMILTAFLLAFLQIGAGDISSQFHLNKSFSEILTGIILFFIIGSEFFIRYRISFRHSAKKGETSHV